jgi:hypothetical protein
MRNAEAISSEEDLASGSIERNRNAGKWTEQPYSKGGGNAWYFSQNSHSIRCDYGDLDIRCIFECMGCV